MTLVDFLLTRYLDGGRDPKVGLDCWGLVRLARHHLMGLPMLPEIAGEFEGRPHRITTAYRKQTAKMRPVPLGTPGSVIAVKRGSVCFHVALMLDDGHVLETVQKTGPRRLPLSAFRAAYSVNTLEAYA